MRSKFLLILLLCSFRFAFSQNVQITSNPGTSGNVVIGGANYHVLEAIYQDGEIGNNNFVTNPITRIDFNCSAIGTGSTTVAGTDFNLYLKEVPATTTTLATGAYSTTGYTLVYSGSFSFTTTGWQGVNLTTPFTRSAGNNLQILIVRTNNVIHTGNVFSCTLGNLTGSTAVTSRRYNSANAPVSGTSSLTASNFRPQIQFYAPTATDAQLNFFGVPNNAPGLSCHNLVSYSMQVRNYGTSTINPGALSVTLKIRGPNTYTNTVSNTSSIATNGFETITFTGVNISNPGTNLDTAYITIAGDNNRTNDTVKFSNITAPTLTLPAVETLEPATLNTIPWIITLSGSRNLWGVRSTAYTNTDQPLPLNAHGGTKFFLFDAYSGANSSGFVSRLFSNCIVIPSGSCPKELSFWMSHDNTVATPELDSLYVSVSVDKGITWTRVSLVGGAAGIQRHDPSLTPGAAPIWRQEFVDLTPYAGQTIQVGFEGVSKYGNAFGLDNIEFRSALQDNVGLRTVFGYSVSSPACDEDGWTYYNDAGSGNAHFAIQWGSNTLSKANSSVTIQLSPTYYSENSGSGASALSTHTMRRNWNVSVGGFQPTTPVNVRFFYDAAEKTATDNDAAAFQASNPGSTLEPPAWFKTVNTTFVPDGTFVTPIGVNNAIPLIDVNATAQLRINNILYAQFNGITSFSGGTYSAGVGSGTILPLLIEYFIGSSNGSENLIRWKLTNTTMANYRMILQSSDNGIRFSEIQNSIVSGSQTSQPFQFVDNDRFSKTKFYQLKLIEADGKITYSKIISLQKRNAAFEVVGLLPTVIKTNATLTIESAVQNAITITTTNAMGQQVDHFNKAIQVGTNNISLNFNKISSGIYFLSIYNKNELIKTVRFVKE